MQSYLRDEGIMDTAALDVDSLFGFEVEGALDKAARLDYGESLMTHAMVLKVSTSMQMATPPCGRSKIAGAKITVAMGLTPSLMPGSTNMCIR